MYKAQMTLNRTRSTYWLDEVTIYNYIGIYAIISALLQG